MKSLWITVPLLLCSCSCLHLSHSFSVLPGQPDYVLRSPDKTITPFPETLAHFNGYQPGKNWLELRPQMELRVENAYYRAGMPKRGLDGFLGTEIAHYRVNQTVGLHQLSIQSMQDRPPDQPPVELLISAPQQHKRRYRFFYAILFKRNATSTGSVLLGAESEQRLQALADQLTVEPDAVCGPNSSDCTVFPEACSVAVEMQIVVNGIPRTVFWSSSLATLANGHQHIELFRPFAGRLMKVNLNPQDPLALRLPLLPGDRLSWRDEGRKGSTSKASTQTVSHAGRSGCHELN